MFKPVFRLCAVMLTAALVVLFSGCRTAPPKEATAKAPPAQALETFDAVWRILYENHFDTNYNGHDWLQVRQQFRPKVEAARSSKEVRDTIQDMLDLLHVSHLAIVPGDLADEMDVHDKKAAAIEEADEGFSGTIGIDVRFAGKDLLVTRVEENSSAAMAGVKPGWILRKAGAMDVREAMKKTPKALDEARRRFVAWHTIARKLSGRPGTSLPLEFLDGRNKPRQVTLTRQTAAGEAIQFGNLPVLYANLESQKLAESDGKNIGLIRFNIWMLPTALAFNRAIDDLRNCDGIILDLRGNLGGMVGMIIGVAGHFMKEPSSLGAIAARDNTLQLPANPRFVNSKGQRVEPYGGPVAILVDEITASASEVFAGGLQELGRVRVFGRTTSGQALPAIYEELPNGDALYHPVADFITPKGTRFEGRGVIPDEIVPLERAALLDRRDLTRERAIHWIRSLK